MCCCPRGVPGCVLWNPGTVVRPVNPPWWKFVGGPNRVPPYTNPAYPDYYQLGGGWQYRIGGWPR